MLAAIVALDGGLMYAEQPGGLLNPTLDRVSSVTWLSNGSALSSGPGFEAYPGSHVLLRLQDTNCLLGCVPIIFTSVVPSPTSFTVVNASLPAISPGMTGNFTVTVATPARAYSGPLALDLS